MSGQVLDQGKGRHDEGDDEQNGLPRPIHSIDRLLAAPLQTANLGIVGRSPQICLSQREPDLGFWHTKAA